MVKAARARSRIVLALPESPHALRLFRSSAEHAMRRAADLVVLDFGATPLHQTIQSYHPQSDAREQKSLRFLLVSPRIKVLRMGPVGSYLDKTVGYCESTGASMLVLGAGDIGSEFLELISRNTFDVLVVGD